MKNRFAAGILAVATLLVLFTSCASEDKTTEFGNPYILHVSKGGDAPKAGEYVYFHYKVRLDDSLVENSWKRVTPNEYRMPDLAETLKNGGKISPVIDGIGHRGGGDSLTIYTKVSDLPMVPDGFESYQFVYYDISLLDVKSEEEYNKITEERQAEAAKRRAVITAREESVAAKVQDVISRYNSGQLADSIQTTASGLKYVMHLEGTGAQATSGAQVRVNYYGSLTDGTMFDNSFRRGDEFAFTLGVGQVIKGWDEGIALLKEGGAATLFIPAALGYGEAGSPPVSPGNSELVFYVALNKVN